MFSFAPPFAGPMMGHHAYPESHGFCPSCCHPRSHCMCGQRQCRKEAKELVVNSDTAAKDIAKVEGLTIDATNYEAATVKSIIRNRVAGTAFIGGGCCVHLSVEYMANLPTQTSKIMVAVEDSEGTTLVWERGEPAGTHYRIKEGIITTKPGAKLTVHVSNATARVRWCEIFSC